MIEFYGFIFILIVGTISHFLYELTGKNKISAIFFATNESTWEHMKLVIGPAFLWLVIELFFIRDNPNFLFAKFVSIFIMTALIPIFFYSYKKVLKKDDILILDILDFILSIAIGQYISYLILNMREVPEFINILSLIGLTIILIAYLTFTKYPLDNFLFNDPLLNKIINTKNTKV